MNYKHNRRATFGCPFFTGYFFHFSYVIINITDKLSVNLISIIQQKALMKKICIFLFLLCCSRIFCSEYFSAPPFEIDQPLLISGLSILEDGITQEGYEESLKKYRVPLENQDYLEIIDHLARPFSITNRLFLEHLDMIIPASFFESFLEVNDECLTFKTGSYLLMEIAHKGDAVLLKWLLSKLTISNELLTQLLLRSSAAYTINRESLRYLLEKGADINGCDETGKTPLLIAVASGVIDNVKFLLQHGADINGKDENGITPLILALSFEDIPMARLLLEHGADIAIADNNGYSPMNYINGIYAIFLDEYQKQQQK